MPRYKIGEIPPQVVWHGHAAGPSVVEFELDARPDAVLTCDAQPDPSGLIQLSGGRFSYTLAAGDTADFVLEFTEVRPDEPEPLRQRVSVFPCATLRVPETELVAQNTPSPPDESADYFLVV